MNRTKFEKPTKTGGKRCFKCGKKGHMAKECRSVDINCFRCRESLHKSSNCPLNVRENRDAHARKTIHTLAEDSYFPLRRIFRDIIVSDKSMCATVDTGSDIRILSYDTIA